MKKREEEEEKKIRLTRMKAQFQLNSKPNPDVTLLMFTRCCTFTVT